MQHAHPVVTIIMPTYRRAQLLRRAIRSVLRQTYPSFQLWVLDDASNDDTESVVYEFARVDSRVRYHKHPTNIGANANFLFGMSLVDTQFFAYTFDDDVLLPNYLNTAIQGFRKYPDAMISGGAALLINESDSIIGSGLSSWPRLGYFDRAEALKYWRLDSHAHITGLLFRSEVIDRVGEIDTDIFTWDFEYELRVVAQYPIVLSGEPCSAVTSHSNATTANTSIEAWWRSQQRIIINLRKVRNLDPQVRKETEDALTHDFSRKIFFLGIHAARKHDRNAVELAMNILSEHYGMNRRAHLLHLYLVGQLHVPQFETLLDVRRAMRSIRSRPVLENAHTDAEIRAYLQQIRV